MSDVPKTFAEVTTDLEALQWAHRRLTEMGYPPEDDDDHTQPTSWWEARPREWAYALEAQADLLADIWADHATDLGFIGAKYGGAR